MSSLTNEHLGVTTLLSIVPFKTRQVGNLPKEFDWKRVEGDMHFTLAAKLPIHRSVNK